MTRVVDLPADDTAAAHVEVRELMAAAWGHLTAMRAHVAAGDETAAGWHRECARVLRRRVQVLLAAHPWPTPGA